MSLKVGTVVTTTSGLSGILRYIGTINAAPGIWCGIELPDASGKNDGSIKDKRYFECPPQHGIFAKKDAVKAASTSNRLSASFQSKPSTSKPQTTPEPIAPVRPSRATTASAKDAEIEDLKAKIRILEKKRLEDRENSKKITKLQAVVDEMALEMTNLRAQLQEEQERPAHLESQLELATLDKEMADDRAANLERELHELRNKHEVLSLEHDILQEENSELSKNMSEEEKANSGWLHLERERDRLREALLMLRDHKQDVESELRDEISNLQANLDETEAAAIKYLEAADKLHRAEETNLHLREQLEAAESQEEVIGTMMQERERHAEQIDALKSQLGQLEDLLQTNDEIEKLYADTEKGLLSRLDEQEATLQERQRKTTEQEQTIEDLEYTLNKLRTMVQGLQSDIDDARRTKEISEVQAHEMNTKARAMVDLNMRLQSNATKSQAKAMEIELIKAQALLANKHVEILTTFVPDGFDSERTSISAFLMFSKLRTKAALAYQMLMDKVSDMIGVDHGQLVLHCIQVTIYMQKASVLAESFVTYMSGCSPEQFHAFNNATQELEPVDQVVTNWLEAVKTDQFGINPGNLKGKCAVLQDMYEKLAPSISPDMKAAQLVSSMRTIHSNIMAIGHLLSWLDAFTDLHLTSTNEKSDEQTGRAFHDKIDKLNRLATTQRYVCNRIAKELEHARAKKKCLGESSWSAFEHAEGEIDELREHLQQVCYSSLQFIDDPDVAAQPSYSTLLAHLDLDPDGSQFTEIFDTFEGLEISLERISDHAMNLKVGEVFSLNPAPWTVRAKELRAQRQMSSELQEDFKAIQRRNAELITRIADNERAMEEVKIRAELAESRLLNVKVKEAETKNYKGTLENLQTAKEVLEHEFHSIQSEVLRLKEQSVQDKEEIVNLRELQRANAKDPSSLPGVFEGPYMTLLDERLNSLLADVQTLHASNRLLSWENAQLQVPISEVNFKQAHLFIGRPCDREKRKRIRNVRQPKQHDVPVSRLLEMALELKPLGLRASPQVGEYK